MASFRRSGSQTSEKGLPGAEDLCEIFVFVRESQLFEKRISCFEVPEAFSGISPALHKKLFLYTTAHQMSLNKYIEQTLENSPAAKMVI